MSPAERLAAISVDKRLPDVLERDAQARADFTFGRSIDAALVGDAIERADADMFVHYVANGRQSVPVEELSDGGLYGTYAEPDISTGRLEKYGMSTLLGYAGEASHFLGFIVEPKPLPDSTPGLVWDVDVRKDGTATATLLTLTGELYAVDLEPRGATLEPGAGPPSGWPPPIPVAFGRWTFLTGRRAQLVSLEAADKAFLKCADRAWARARPKLPADAQEADQSRAKVIKKSCEKEVAAVETAMADNVEGHLEARTFLVDRARAKLGKP